MLMTATVLSLFARIRVAVAKAQRWLNVKTCGMRGHPYPFNNDADAYEGWLNGSEPFPPVPWCSNCGKPRPRCMGMRS